MSNEYRDAVLAFKRQWISYHYGELDSAGLVGKPSKQWMDSIGGTDKIPVDGIDSFGDLLSRSLTKSRFQDKEAGA